MNFKKTNICGVVFFLSFLSHNAFAEDLTNINESHTLQQNTDKKFFDNYMKQTQKFISQNIQLIDKPQIDNVSNIISPFLNANTAIKEAVLADKQNQTTIVDPKETQAPEQIAEVQNSEPTKKEKSFFDNYLDSTHNFINKSIGFFVPTSENKDTIVTDKKESFIEKYSNITQSVLAQGIQYIGVPYRWGGNTESNGFDCSGYVRAVFQNSIGLSLPRTAKEMSSIGEKIQTMSSLKPGDLVFFNTMRKTFSHVGIYLGDNKFLHAPKKGDNVKVEEIDKNYWIKRFNGARRLVSADTTEINIK